MTGPVARILARYLAMALVAHGYLAQADGSVLGVDPDVVQVIEVSLGLAVSAVTEMYYVAAKRFGWGT